MGKKAAGIFINGLTILFLILFIFVWICTWMGVKSYTILSSSMEPTLSVGNLVLVRNKEEIKCNDMIAFRLNGNVVIHRVVDIKNGERFVTKGDANKTADLNLVEREDMIGTVWITLKKLNWLWYLVTSKTRYGVIAGVIGLNMLKEKHDRTEGGIFSGNH